LLHLMRKLLQGREGFNFRLWLVDDYTIGVELSI